MADELYPTLKFRASAVRKPLKEVVHDVLEAGLRASAPLPAGRPRLGPNVIVPATGKAMRAWSNAQLHAIDARDEGVRRVRRPS